jgi:hypothetical protein
MHFNSGLLQHMNLISGVLIIQSRGSVVGIATGYRLDNRGVPVRVPVGSRMVTFLSIYIYIYIGTASVV